MSGTLESVPATDRAARGQGRWGHPPAGWSWSLTDVPGQPGLWLGHLWPLLTMMAGRTSAPAIRESDKRELLPTGPGWPRHGRATQPVERGPGVPPLLGLRVGASKEFTLYWQIENLREEVTA